MVHATAGALRRGARAIATDTTARGRTLIKVILTPGAGVRQCRRDQRLLRQRRCVAAAICVGVRITLFLRSSSGVLWLCGRIKAVTSSPNHTGCASDVESCGCGDSGAIAETEYDTAERAVGAIFASISVELD